MGEMFIWTFTGLGALLIGVIIYDECLKCRHEWEQHTFEKGGVTKTYLTCTKCGKIKMLK